MATLDQRHLRIRTRLGLTQEQYEDPLVLAGVLERELNLWGTPFPKVGSPPPPPINSSFKVALVVGHKEKKNSQGAYAPEPLATYEWPFNHDVARITAARFSDHPNIEVKVFHRQDIGSYWEEIDEVYKRIDNWIGQTRGITVEIHFNDLRTDDAPIHGVGGKETIYSGSVKGKALSRIFQDASPLPIKNRGLKERSKNDRGGRSVHASSFPSTLLEPFDGRNPSNNQLAFELGVDGFADAWEQAIILAEQSIEI